MDRATNDEKAQDVCSVMGLKIPPSNNDIYISQSEENNEYIDNILEHVARGWQVFPCKADKTPHTADGFKSASKDTDQIRRWWATWPTALVGVATGERSGLLVIDVDVKDGAKGLESLRQLVSVNGELPTTWVAETRSGGFHYFFKNVTGAKCSISKLGSGIDVRADGGYVIVAPSHGYRWLSQGVQS